MAQKVRAEFICDQTGVSSEKDPSVSTRSFSFDGRHYQTELSDAAYAELARAVAPYAEKARPSGRPAAGGPKARTTAGRERSAAIRAWARENGHVVSERGRIPLEIVREYDRSQ